MSSTALTLLATALNRDAESLPADANVANTDGWDSLAHARVILALEEALGRQLETAEIAGIAGLADIEGLLSGQRVDA